MKNKTITIRLTEPLLKALLNVVEVNTHLTLSEAIRQLLRSSMGLPVAPLELPSLGMLPLPDGRGHFGGSDG